MSAVEPQESPTPSTHARTVLALGALLVGWLGACGNPFLTASCNDGLDNEGDGLADLDDPDCEGDSDREVRATEPTDAGLDAGPSLDGGATGDAARPGGDAGPAACDLGVDPVCEAVGLGTRCGPDLCVDIRTDPNHCGACGLACGATEACRRGGCVDCASVGSGFVRCDDRCTDLRFDRRNCGECGTVCGSGQVCENRSCRMAGGGPQRGQRCDDAVDVTTNVSGLAVTLENTAAFEARAVPSCQPDGSALGRARLYRVEPGRDGMASFALRVDAGRPLIQLFLDDQCTCAIPQGCATGPIGGEAVTDVAVRMGQRVTVLFGTTAEGTGSVEAFADVGLPP